MQSSHWRADELEGLPDYSGLSRFSGEAVESLAGLSSIIAAHQPRSLSGMQETVRLLQRAARFSLPENGALLDLKGYRSEFSEMLRLPYPSLTLEFRTTRPPEPGQIKSSRSIILCWQGDHQTPFRIETEPQEVIYFTNIWFDDEQGEWEPSPVAWGFRPADLRTDPDNGISVDGFHHFPCHVEAYDKLRNEHGEEWLDADLARSFEPLLEFCLTVNCQNVQMRAVAPPVKLNAKRVKKGKLPLDSYHVLVLPGAEREESLGGESNPQGPRAHWRRGHIRRLGDGRVIWIRHALVGNREQGAVRKEYRVEAEGG